MVQFLGPEQQVAMGRQEETEEKVARKRVRVSSGVLEAAEVGVTWMD